MSTSESGEGQELVADEQGEEKRASEFVSSLEGWALVRKYLVGGQVVEIETMILKKEIPTLDLSAGWRVIHESSEMVWIERII